VVLALVDAWWQARNAVDRPQVDAVIERDGPRTHLRGRSARLIGPAFCKAQAVLPLDYKVIAKETLTHAVKVVNFAH
jgi:hypothetical protein